MIHDFGIRVFVFSYFSSLAEFFQVFFCVFGKNKGVHFSLR